MLLPEELEDLEDDFLVEHSEEIDAFDGEMVDASKRSDYDAFMKAWKSLKELCFAGGEGGKFYFERMWKNDPRIKDLERIKAGPLYSDVVSMLSEYGPSESKDIYALVSGADYKALQKLVRTGSVLRIEGSHIYYLPGQEVSGITARLSKAEEDARAVEEEFKDVSEELTIPSTDELVRMISDKAEEIIRNEDGPQDRADRGEKKKRRGFLSFFKKK